MASAEEKQSLGGHGPAVKVGGRRVSRPRKDSDKSDQPKEPKSEEELHGSSFSTFKPPVIVAGIPPKPEFKDLPKEETKLAHEKLVPTHQHQHQQKPTVIQQPRK